MVRTLLFLALLLPIAAKVHPDAFLFRHEDSARGVIREYFEKDGLAIRGAFTQSMKPRIINFYSPSCVSFISLSFVMIAM